MLIRMASSLEWVVVVVMGGFALVNNNKVTILVNEAELGSVVSLLNFILNLNFYF